MKNYPGEGRIADGQSQVDGDGDGDGDGQSQVDVDGWVSYIRW